MGSEPTLVTEVVAQLERADVVELAIGLSGADLRGDTGVAAGPCKQRLAVVGHDVGVAAAAGADRPDGVGFAGVEDHAQAGDPLDEDLKHLVGLVEPRLGAGVGRVVDLDDDRRAIEQAAIGQRKTCLLYTSPSPRDQRGSRMPSSA